MNTLPRNEYPRPQFVRPEWMNLNGVWTYRIVKDPHFSLAHQSLGGIQHSEGFDETILVPFAPESELSTVEHTDFIPLMYYHRSLDIPVQWEGKRILLHFGAVFYHAEIFIDGELVDFHDGGSSSFTVDLSRGVTAGARHNLVVKVTSNLWDGTTPSGKQSSLYNSYTCFYTRTTGIWQTVWMEAVEHTSLKRVRTLTNIHTKTITFTPQFHSAPADSMTLLTEVLAEGIVVASVETVAREGVPYTLDLEQIRLWDVEDPYLYELRYTLISGTKTLDQVDSYLGFREVRIEGNEVYLNGKMLYQRLVLDQGYYPQSQWTAPSDEALKQDILLSKDLGFNGARLHQKVFEERFYYWADTLGYLCWAESPSWGIDYNTEGLAARNFLSEWAEIILRDVNHPSIITWTPFNETYQFTNPLVHRRVHRDAYNLCKLLDPSRPVNDASGYIHYVTDLWTVHTYEQDPAKLKEQLALDAEGQPFRNFPAHESPYGGQPYLVDEFGGIKWDPKTQAEGDLAMGQNLVSWGYGKAPTTLEEFYHRLEMLTGIVNDYSHIAGYCYTQLTDVELEKNGLYTYNREQKFDTQRLRAVFTRTPERYKK